MKFTTMRDFSEKRDYIRMRIDAEIELRSADGEVVRGVCKDLSGTGMQIELDQSVPIGTELQTSLPSHSEAFPSFDTTVKVLRSTPLENGNYLIGVEIVRVS